VLEYSCVKHELSLSGSKTNSLACYTSEDRIRYNICVGGLPYFVSLASGFALSNSTSASFSFLRASKPFFTCHTARSSSTLSSGRSKASAIRLPSDLCKTIVSSRFSGARNEDDGFSLAETDAG